MPFGMTQSSSALAVKLKGLGAESDDLDALLRAKKRRIRVAARAAVVRENDPLDQWPVLLVGLTGACKRTRDGKRHLHSLQHPGDFCHLYRYALAEDETESGVVAVTDAVVAMIEKAALERLLARPSLALAFWRATMVEATFGRQRLAIAKRGSALERV